MGQGCERLRDKANLCTEKMNFPGQRPVNLVAHFLSGFTVFIFAFFSRRFVFAPFFGFFRILRMRPPPLSGVQVQPVLFHFPYRRTSV